MCAQVFDWTLAYSGVEVVRWTSSWLIVQHHKMTQPGNVKKLALQQWMLASCGVEVARWTTVVLDLLRQLESDRISVSVTVTAPKLPHPLVSVWLRLRP